MGSSDEGREIVRHELGAERREELLGAAARCLLGLPGVRLAFAFGSFVAGRPFRDLDIGVLFVGRPRWQDPGRVARAVWEAIGRPPFEVDVVTLNDATAELRLAVARSGRLLAEPRPGEAEEVVGLARTELIDREEWRRARAARRS